MINTHRTWTCAFILAALLSACTHHAERGSAGSAHTAAAASGQLAQSGSLPAPEPSLDAASPRAEGSAPEPALPSGRPLPAPPAPPMAAARKGAEHLEFGLGGGDTTRAQPAVKLRAARTPLQTPSPELQAPPEEFDTEAYAALEETPFVHAKDAPLSTFSIDVDTASYSNVRRFLNQGQLPPSGAVRVEELVNYFSYDYPDPSGDAPFSVTTEVSQAPWNPAHRLLQVGLQGRRLRAAELPPRSLVFLLDVSGSMAEPNKLPLLKRSLSTLVDTLTERDQVAIVVYAGASGLVLPPTAGHRKAEILTALDRLEAGGSTNGGQGIELAYAAATRMARPGSTNRVILATDGDFNVGVTSQSELFSLIEQKRRTGVYLSVLGFGMGNYKDDTLELLADKGNGNYAYIDSLAEARKVLVAQAGATLSTLAKDVKLQLEFNPATVGAYRLIGYENRRLAARDFNDDAKDAGELGAGHSVTALYEIVPPGVAVEGGRVDPLRYQSASTLQPGHSQELCTLKLRYKQRNAEHSRLLEHVVQDTERALSRTSADFRFAAAVAAFGMSLRGSPERGSASLALARTLAEGALGADQEGYRREFLSLLDTARSLQR